MASTFRSHTPVAILALTIRVQPRLLSAPFSIAPNIALILAFLIV